MERGLRGGFWPSGTTEFRCPRDVSVSAPRSPHRTNPPPAMATIFATRAAVSVRPTLRASAEDKVPLPLLPPRAAPVRVHLFLLSQTRHAVRARARLTSSPASLISDAQAVAAPSLPHRIASGVAAAALSASVALGSPSPPTPRSAFRRSTPIPTAASARTWATPSARPTR